MPRFVGSILPIRAKAPSKLMRIKVNQMDERIGNVCITPFGATPDKVYCEGEAVEEFLLNVLKNQEDPIEVMKKDHRWPIMYQLSPSRKNIVQPMQIGPNSRVLELGAGMGAVTAALAPRCGHVDCVDLSLLRCRANAYRNREYGNIHIYVGNIMDFQPADKYDVVLLIGVLEYAAEFSNGNDPFRQMLKLCRQHLKEGGLIYIAIENRLGAKYFAGCNEDHLGRPFVGIEGYPCDEKIRTFSRSELLDLVQSSGFGSPFFYYPLPDYKLPRMIYSDAYLPRNDLSFPYRSNYDADRLVCFEEVSLLRSLGSTQEFCMLANSFLLEAKAE